ncbi:MAG TPA: YggS family pyridoxal phosphate-dependent enzyme, partial [Saprospiraceae bacterium]|nr:YggS family pyridoxal phosphate-dependent enzyme [Saprospiraceae bacterium]
MNLSHYFDILREAQAHKATLVVVTKNQKLDDILSLYDAGHRIFGENRVQQLIEKKEQLPADIQWHMIGSLQKNKVKYLAPWISMIHSVDSFGLAETINREALKSNRIIPILLEVKISSEESKHGFQNDELMSSLQNDPWNTLTHCALSGLMGMASFTDNPQQ